MKKHFKKLVLIVLDGFGLAPAGKGNAELLADMKNLNSLIAAYPSFSLVASSLIVGLPWGKFGNSEVGHSAIGTGRIITQDWARINRDIVNKSFFKNEAFLGAIKHAKKNNSAMHIVGCMSPGGIHAHEDHLFALLELMEEEKVPNVFIHVIADGEDALPKESERSFKKLEPFVMRSRAKVATVLGRAYAMDRVLNWKLTEAAWGAMVKGNGEPIADPFSYIVESHKKGIFDDEIIPATVMDGKDPVRTVQDNDAMIFFNYRNDRMKQIASSFASDDFKGFLRKPHPKNIFITTMTRYAEDIPVQAVAYEALDIPNTLGAVLSAKKMPQLRVAEKEKEAHVTNFFNGGKLAPFSGENRMIVSSKALKAKELVEYPQMSAQKIVDTVLKESGKYPLTVVNFANADLVAHTGDFKATIKALKILDDAIGDISAHVLKDPDAALIITCDHGNAEELIDPLTGGPDTQHSTSNVMALFAGKGLEEGTGKTLESLADENPTGSLIDIAPSVLSLMGIPKPEEMTGSALL